MDASIKIQCTFFSTKALDLLLPNSAIAEVIISPAIEQINNNETQWIIGELNWQNQKIVIIDYDKLDPKQSAEPSLKSAPKNVEHEMAVEYLVKNKFIIIVRNPEYTSIEKNIPFFGISINKIPHVIEANAHNLDKDLQPRITHSYAASYASINNKVVIIPNINHIFSAVKESNQLN